MTDWFLSGGVVMWPLLALAFGVVASAVRAGMKSDSTASGRTLVPILFWGAVALLVGALGTVTGLVIMARRIAVAGGASSGLVWGGVGVSLISLAFGILIFLLSGFLWLALDAWRRRLATRSGAAA